MKTYEVEIERKSYVVCTVQGEDVDSAKDAAWRWYESVMEFNDDQQATIVYCEETV